MGYTQITRTLVNKTITNGSLTIDFTKSSGITFSINAPNHGLVGTSTITINSATNANDGYQAIFNRNIIGKTFECSTLDTNTLILNQKLDNFFNPITQQLFAITTTTLSFNVVNNDFLYAVQNQKLRLEVNFNGVVGTELNITNKDGLPSIISWTNQTSVNITQSGNSYVIADCLGAIYKFKSTDASKPIILKIFDLQD